jgi:xylulokinase
MHGVRFLASLLQFRLDSPREFARAARAMVAKDYVLFQLTGHAVTDRASTLDQEAWPEGVTGAPEFENLRFSEIREPWQTAGTLRASVAAQLGLAGGIPIATGAHDGAAATVGAGAAHAGAHSVTLGTNCVYRIISDQDEIEQSRFWTVLPGLTAYGADITLGGFAVDWATRVFGSSHARLSDEASLLSPGSDGVVFLPQMGGRILPAPNSSLAAAFAGIRRTTGPAHLYRAVLEGNAFALKSAREALLSLGLPKGPVYLTGGGTRGALWRQILADVFAEPVAWAGVEEGCRGGAILAGVASGVWPDVRSAMAAMTTERRELAPSPAGDRYAEAYQRFLKVRDAYDHA